MPSTHETIGLVAFASRVPAIFVRRNMKKYLLSTLDPDGKLRRAEDNLIDGIAALRRKPDAVAILDELQSKAADLPEHKHILFVEVEHSAPIPVSSLNEYANIHDYSFDTELPHLIALAVVDRYGSVRYIDLGGIYTAMIFLGGQGISQADAINAHVVRNSANV
jgi:hypothetical protein